MSVDFSPTLLAVGGARTGVAPANLLDVQDVNGNLYYLSDRPMPANTPLALPAAFQAANTPPTPPVPIPPGQGMAYAYPTAVALVQAPGFGTVKANLSQGTINCAEVAFFATELKMIWSGFVMPTLPPGAVLESAYIVATMVNSGGVPLGASIFTPFELVLADTSGVYSEEISPAGPDIEVSDITAATASFGLGGSEGGFGLPISQTMFVEFIAIEILYSMPGGNFGGGGGGSNGINAGPSLYLPWLISIPALTFHRSLQTDVGNFILQNLSGDTLSRDPEKLLRASAFEGAFFVYRCWQEDAQEAWIEVHGLLTVPDGGVSVDTWTLKGSQTLNPAQDDTPLEQYCETCQLQWGGPRCGSTEADECDYSFQSCQVIERPMITINDYEKNYGEATANTALTVINRRRKI